MKPWLLESEHRLLLQTHPQVQRMAIGEALTNLRSAPVGQLQNVKLCANWMAAAGVEGEAAALYESVRSVALELCQGS